MKAMPAAAGLKRFLPVPPNAILTSKTAKAVATIPSQKGAVGESIPVINKAVIREVPSFICGFLFKSRQAKASQSTAVAMLRKASNNGREPKNTVEKRKRGTKAINASNDKLTGLAIWWTKGARFSFVMMRPPIK